MTYDDVLTQITTLPSTYLRSGAIFEDLMSSFAFSISRYTNSADALQAMLNIETMDYKWLNLIGIITGINRLNNETISQYRTRIQSIIAESQGTPVSILEYLQGIGINSTYSDYFSGPGVFGTSGYTLDIETPSSNYNGIAVSLARVRPAGVPFAFNVLNGGFYVDSINFVEAWDVTGAYLVNPYTNLDYTIPTTTNNNNSLGIPTTFLTDPTINPSLA